MRYAGDSIGTVTPHVATTTGIDPGCTVACGIHDSNASYLQFLIGREPEPFTAVSSGTWAIVMANRVGLTRLEERRDMLANVDAFGTPVATARFMAGREYEAIARTDDAGTAGQSAANTLTVDTLIEIMHIGAMALPSFANGGPYARSKGSLIHAEALTANGRTALATLYTALMTDLLIESLGAVGDSSERSFLAAMRTAADRRAARCRRDRVLPSRMAGAPRAHRRGNLTSDGAITFGYDTENRLTAASDGNYSSLKYDPL